MYIQQAIDTINRIVECAFEIQICHRSISVSLECIVVLHIKGPEVEC